MPDESFRHDTVVLRYRALPTRGSSSQHTHPHCKAPRPQCFERVFKTGVPSTRFFLDREPGKRTSFRVTKYVTPKGNLVTLLDLTFRKLFAVFREFRPNFTVSSKRSTSSSLNKCLCFSSSLTLETFLLKIIALLFVPRTFSKMSSSPHT